MKKITILILGIFLSLNANSEKLNTYKKIYNGVEHVCLAEDVCWKGDWYLISVEPSSLSYLHAKYLGFPNVDVLEDGTYRAWIKIELIKPILEGEVKVMFLYQIDPKAQKIKALQGTGYDENGKVTNQLTRSTEWKYITPDTDGETFYQVLKFFGDMKAQVLHSKKIDK